MKVRWCWINPKNPRAVIPDPDPGSPSNGTAGGWEILNEIPDPVGDRVQDDSPGVFGGAVNVFLLTYIEGMSPVNDLYGRSMGEVVIAKKTPSNSEMRQKKRFQAICVNKNFK